MAASELVIFDLDGTLLDTIEDLGEAVNHALSVRSLPLHTAGEYRFMVGHGVRNLCRDALASSLGNMPDEALVDEVMGDFMAYYMEHIDAHTRPYPGICGLLSDLKIRGLKLAVASNKFQAGAERLVAEFFPDIDFVAVLGNGPEFPLKPDAGVVDFIRAKAGVSREGTVFVGDSGTDIRTARNGGVRSIAVSWGFRPVSDLLEADAVANSPEEIAGLL